MAEQENDSSPLAEPLTRVGDRWTLPTGKADCPRIASKISRTQGLGAFELPHG